MNIYLLTISLLLLSIVGLILIIIRSKKEETIKKPEFNTHNIIPTSLIHPHSEKNSIELIKHLTRISELNHSQNNQTLIVKEYHQARKKIENTSDQYLTIPFIENPLEKNIFFIDEEQNTPINSNIINLLLSTPSTHNKLCSLESISSLSISITLLSELRKASFRSFSYFYFYNEYSRIDEKNYGSLILFNEHSQPNIEQVILLSSLLTIHFKNNILLNQNIELKNTIKRGKIAITEVKHDIQNSLLSIQHLTRNLMNKSDALPSDTVSHLNGASTLIEANIGKLNWSLSSEHTANNLKETKDRINLVLFIKSIFNALKPQAKSKKLSYILVIDDSLPDYIDCKRDALTQIIFNLLSNAIKYSNRGFIALSIKNLKTEHPENFKIEFRIEDTGIGIDTTELDRIFDYQYRTNNLSPNGLGIGLHITKNAVSSINGTLNVKSKPNSGSKFSLCIGVTGGFFKENNNTFTKPDLVLSSEDKDLLLNTNSISSISPTIISITDYQAFENIKLELQNKNHSISAIIIHSKDRFKIRHRYKNIATIKTPNRPIRTLVVDDQPEICAYWNDKLTPFGFEITTSTSAEEAIIKIKKSDYDLILSDQNLSTSTKGSDIFKKLRAEDNITPFILFSSDPNAELSNSIGIDTLLEKTISTEELLEKIEFLFSYRKDIIFTERDLPNLMDKAYVKEKNIEHSTSSLLDLVEIENKKNTIIKIIDKLGSIDDQSSLVFKKIASLQNAYNQQSFLDYKRSLHDLKNIAIMLSMKGFLNIIQNLKLHENHVLPNAENVRFEFYNGYKELVEHIQKITPTKN